MTPFEKAIAAALAERGREGIPGEGFPSMSEDDAVGLVLRRSLEQARAVREAIQAFDARLSDVEARLNGIEARLDGLDFNLKGII